MWDVQLRKKNQELVGIEEKISSTNMRIKEKDTDELVTAAIYSVDEDWRWFKSHEVHYSLV